MKRASLKNVRSKTWKTMWLKMKNCHYCSTGKFSLLTNHFSNKLTKRFNLRMHENDVKVFLLTNSGYEYTDVSLKDWVFEK